ncbi:coiled-coil domain-containing protein 18 isoform X2 [Ambystoma mexicanum]|uniref:coiled-coil domain-containing protein 18 isoform X2 n=1 Tax=Ambystoma mexicanum TaxID=8296 RepID=UPI0037E8101F
MAGRAQEGRKSKHDPVVDINYCAHHSRGKHTTHMEPNLPPCHKDEEDSLIANVWALRNQLMKTERSLQHLGEQLYSDSSSDSSNCISPSSVASALTLEDCEQPVCDCSPKACHEEKMSCHQCDYQRRTRDQPSSAPAASYRKIEQENKQFREKLNSLREQNASLVSQNQCLMSAIESVQCELSRSKSKVSFFESIGTHSFTAPQLEQQVHKLEAEVHSQDKALRLAEGRLEQSQKHAAEKEQTVQRFKDDIKKLKIELLERNKYGKRAEQQRNEALVNAEELRKAFQLYKEKIAVKLEKVKQEEEALQTQLYNSENEKHTLQEQCKALKAEVENVQEQFRLLKSEAERGKERLQCIDAKNTELITLLTQSNQRLVKLEAELQDKENILATSNGTGLQNEELKACIAKQNEKLLFCQKEIENSKSELGNLKILTQMSFQNGPFPSKWKGTMNQLDVSKTNADVFTTSGDSARFIAERRSQPPMKPEESKMVQINRPNSRFAQPPLLFSESQGSGEANCLETEPVKLIANQEDERKRQRLELACKELEKEKETLITQIEVLKTKLTKAESEISSVKLSMSQRTCQFQAIQEELLEKAEKTSKLEREMAKRRLQIAALEQQLNEKKTEFSSISARNSELEEELSIRDEQIRNLDSRVNREYKEAILAFENTQSSNLQELKKKEEEIEQLQDQLEKKQLKFKEQDNTISVMQKDILSKQRKIESLDRKLTDTKMEMETQNVKNHETMKMLQTQVAEEGIQVKHLDSALAICKEELELYFNQLEENKDNFEKQITKKSEEVKRLQKELKLKSQSLQETSEHNVCLQQSLQQQQQMLQKGTARIAELEDSQAELEKQISKLEQDLHKQKSANASDHRRLEEKLHMATQETDLRNQQLLELGGKMKELKLELKRSKEEVMGKEEELMHLQDDGEAKAVQLSHMEMLLQHTQADLDTTTALAARLKADLQQSESEKQTVIQKREELECEVQGIQEELNDTVRRLKELQDVLQRAQLCLEEKKIAIQDLTSDLRTGKIYWGNLLRKILTSPKHHYGTVVCMEGPWHCKSEIAERDLELDDLKQTLKERNWELKQRAAQLTQLDMNIQEHRGEMEQTIIRLEGALETSKLNIKDYINQITNLDEKLQQTTDHLREKDFEVIQKDQQLNHQKKETERKERKISELEKIIKDHEQCIKDQHQDALDASQPLREGREQIQKLKLELMETQHQLVQVQRETESLKHKLEEANLLNREKEIHGNKLAEELGALQERETCLKERLQVEVKKLKTEIESLKDSHQQEILMLQKSNADVQMCTDHGKSANHYLNERLRHLTHELDEAQDQVNSLQTGLQARNEVIQATNEALLVKESEVMRLKARISAYERTAGVSRLYSSLDASPQRIAVLNVPNLSTPTSGLKYRTMRRSISAGDLSMKDDCDSLDISTRMLDDLIHILPVPDASKIQDGFQVPDDSQDSSFNPLTYTLDEDAINTFSDRGDLGTLSGMLRFITTEMKIAEGSCG